MNPKISIIVPIYNAESTLRRCVDSIFAQTFRNFELILIDDGSRDHSAEIIDDYAALDSRVIPIHKENGGVSSARNAGLEIARGEYITFIDSDDWIKERYLENIFHFDKYDCSLIICNYSIIGCPIHTSKYEEQFLNSANEITHFINLTITDCLTRVPWGKFFRRESIKLNNLQFDQKIHFGEDTEFVFKYIASCNNILISEDDSYQYYIDGYKKNKYKISTKQYKYSIEKVMSALALIGSKSKLKIAYKEIQSCFQAYFESSLWNNGFSFAKKNSQDWIKLKMWKYLPVDSTFFKIKYILKVLLWTKLYYRNINKTSDSNLRNIE